ncbi:MAG: ATP-dependent DNA helicase [Gammaproteobacteria bacterium]|jgi:ATP-dependent DNA helicase DinG|nr:ATP-dependent DNA helicase [Gammaproteobacteria bacterium]MDP6615787.1 ATP-dependent DNA helicase [Gammaproteobacteria bacterium]MDP6695527.1 ATP-dependent DNA helicase [Gammaproteobacteria bacterium]
MALIAPDEFRNLSELFGTDSPLAGCIDGYAPRAGQAGMAAAVAAAIEDCGELVVEAGTGTGKTLAYLVPALLSGKRVVLSTGTKTLQDQLFHRDLPAVAGALGRPVTVVQLKGRSNYLCLQRLRVATEQPQLHDHSFTAELQMLTRWSLATRTGDRVEVGGIPEDSPVWPRVTSTLENCIGTQCEFYDRCHVVSARQAALNADIVVVNHHLLLADLVLKEEGFGELLPGCEAVVIDEAHQFPDIAQDFFNVSITSRSLLDLAADIRAESLTSFPADLDITRLVDTLVKAVRDLRLNLPAAASNILWDEISVAAFRELDNIVASLDDLISWHECIDESMSGLRRCRERACASIESIEQISRADESAGLRWAGLTKAGFTLNYTPVEFSGNLHNLLAAQSCAWIFTSATLAVGGDFSHFLVRMGIPDATTLEIASPFDFAGSGLLYLPDALPEPAAANYTESVVQRLLPLIAASNGRAFLLFTSHRALREAAQIMRDRDDCNYPLLVQGEAPRSKLLEQFAELENPVLLGTSSFWEGVDMRGDRLVLVAIDKLPFASPGDPMLKARLAAISEQGGQPFRDYQLPQAVLALKQGVGRLIRDESDYGVVVVCDPRVTSRNYGRRFLASLPPFTVTQDSLDAEEFLRNGSPL